MKFEYKDIDIDGKKFMIKFLTEVEDYELEVSKGKITIGIFYYPDRLIGLSEAESNMREHFNELMIEVSQIIDNNSEFYKDYISETKFKGLGVSGSSQYGEAFAHHVFTTLTLTKKELCEN